MVKKYQWFEIAGSDLPQYTYIPADMEILSDEEMKPFDLSRKQMAWYLDRNSNEELYIPLFPKKVGELNG